MRKLGLFCLSMVATLACTATRADDSALLQEIKDRAAIEALMWKYVRALDTLDVEGYAAAYTDDGEFHAGATTEKGQAALKKMVADLKKDRADREAAGKPKSAPMYHVIANHDIEFTDRDHATYSSYWMTVFGAVGQDTPVRVAAAGHGVDRLVRVNGKWLIKSRDVAPAN